MGVLQEMQRARLREDLFGTQAAWFGAIVFVSRSCGDWEDICIYICYYIYIVLEGDTHTLFISLSNLT